LLFLLYRWLYVSEGPLEYLRLFRYLSVRTIGGALCAFIIAVIVGPRLIAFLHRKGLREQSRDVGNLAVSTKKGTPTMGGVLILGSTLASAVLWCNPMSRFVQIALGCGLLFGGLGACDDVLKMRAAASEGGLPRKFKYLGQVACGTILAVLMLVPAVSPLAVEGNPAVARTLYVPFLKTGLYLGVAYLGFLIIFMVLASNAVNLTDGMDGLAIVPAIFVTLVLGVFAYVTGREDWSVYLQYPYVPGAGELMVLCGILAGAGAGFLWFNAYPASVMMGDTGSLALGGLLGTIAVLIKQELLFFVAGGLFVVEALSTFVQDYLGLKLLGRRILFRAPLHHSLLYRGVGETKVTIRLWIIAAVFAVLALATLKLR